MPSRVHCRTCKFVYVVVGILALSTPSIGALYLGKNNELTSEATGENGVGSNTVQDIIANANIARGAIQPGTISIYVCYRFLIVIEKTYN